MSEDFGKNERFPALPEITQKDIREMYPQYAHLENPKYNSLLKDYYACVTGYLNDFYDPAVLEKQLERRDLDTVCAYELYQMKKNFTTSDSLNLSTFVQKN